MKTQKRTLILQETHEVLSVRLLVYAPPRRASVWCDVCEGEVPLLTPEEAALATGVGARAIYCLVEAGLIHFQETPDGLLLVCPNKIKERGHDTPPSPSSVRL
jgi:hypothetical protein